MSTTAEEIVRALADANPNADTGDMTHACGLCLVSMPMRPQDHEADCPWRLAVEWVKSMEVSPREQAIVGYFTKELPGLEPKLGIARDILLVLDKVKGTHQ